uniref:BTB domain-containing protein n=1 Tax=Globodera rostochiensis TaxID=31243 RepID=A0A914I7L5_GLORO
MTEDSALKSVIGLRIERVADLDGATKFSPVKSIAKLPWRLEVRKSAGEGQYSPPTLAVYVWCNWANKSQCWRCKAIVKFVIKSRELDFVRNFEHAFCARQPRAEDTLEIEAQIAVNEIVGYGVPPKEDQLFVNGSAFDVNKYLLAAHSPYFRAFFFHDNFRECKTQTFTINDSAVEAELFGMMLECMYPESGKPTDDCVETILQLSDKYDLAVVKERCERFLIEESRRCMVFKFRMAEHYGLTSLKNHCFECTNTIDFCSDLIENVGEFTELCESSKQCLSTHLAMLCETEKTKQNLATMLQRGVEAQQQQQHGLFNAFSSPSPDESSDDAPSSKSWSMF